MCSEGNLLAIAQAHSVQLVDLDSGKKLSEWFTEHETVRAVGFSLGELFIRLDGEKARTAQLLRLPISESRRLGAAESVSGLPLGCGLQFAQSWCTPDAAPAVFEKLVFSPGRCFRFAPDCCRCRC